MSLECGKQHCLAGFKYSVYYLIIQLYMYVPLYNSIYVLASVQYPAHCGAPSLSNYLESEFHTDETNGRSFQLATVWILESVGRPSIKTST